MGISEVREKYLRFFKNKGHKEISSSPLIIDSDPTTLFTGSGMQQLISYFKGSPHPQGSRLVNSQPSLRLQDMDEVGDNRHTTFFEMLGNWSLGDYFKEEQLRFVWDFLTRDLGIESKKLHISIFAGSKKIPKDIESFDVWKKIGVSENNIHFYADNWWSRAGNVNKMPAGEIGGPDSEVFYMFDKVSHDSGYGKFCHPNCDCGKFLEIGNSVFMQYQKNNKGDLIELSQKNVDFGGGLERITAAVLNEPDIFKIDVFRGVIGKIEKEIGLNYGSDPLKDKSFRIISDHLRASANLIAEGVVPSNKLHGYALRKLIRRAMFHFHLLGFGISAGGVSHLTEEYRSFYPSVDKNWQLVEEGLSTEAVRFEAALKRGLARLTKAVSEGFEIDGKFAFDLYQTEGFPFELTIEVLSRNGIVFSQKEKNIFTTEFEKHKESSRTASAGMFKGGLAEAGVITTKLHTTTHLLQASLKQILGEQVRQSGSHITAERLRFDFTYPGRLTDEEIKKVEDLVNQKIKEDLPVTFRQTNLQEAIKEGATHFFAEKYGNEVRVYTIGKSWDKWFSKEICGGPHVTSTGEIGNVKIIRQEKIGAGVVRLYMILSGS